MNPAREFSPDSFVGRDFELGVLIDRAGSRGTGSRWPVLVVGDPGIGKTRLLQELAERPSDEHRRVVWGRAWDEIECPPYWPWTNVVRELIGETTAADLRHLVLDEPEHAGEAIAACRAAAAQVTSDTAHDEAVVHLERAMAVLDRNGSEVLADPRRERLEILLDLGPAQRRADLTASADETFEVAAELASELGDATLVADLAVRSTDALDALDAERHRYSEATGSDAAAGG